MVGPWYMIHDTLEKQYNKFMGYIIHMNRSRLGSATIDATTLHGLFQEAKRDASLSNFDVEQLLSAVENDKYAYLENKSLRDISKEIVESLSELPVSADDKLILCQKLVDYRHVDELDQLHIGKYVRWIRKRPLVSEASAVDLASEAGETRIVETGKCFVPTLTAGGVVVDIKFEKTGTQMLIRNNNHRFTRCKFDDCIVFQKLSPAEQMLLGCYELVANS